MLLPILKSSWCYQHQLCNPEEQLVLPALALQE
jgi:hypothetical protein